MADHPDAARARRPFLAAATILAAATVALACSSDGERAVVTTTTEAATAIDQARAACTEVLADRSEAVSREAAEAATTLREALELDEAPPEELAAGVQDALGAELGQLADARATLAEVVVPAASSADWAAVVGSVDAVLADLDATLGFLRDPDWTRDPSAVGLPAPTPDRVRLDAALTRLDLLGSDCQWVYDYPGDPADAAPFHHDAAAACAAAVERRREAGFDPAAEWERTATDLAEVDAGTLEAPAPWTRIVGRARAAAAGEAPDPDAEPTAHDDLVALGLDQRPCAALGL